MEPRERDRTEYPMLADAMKDGRIDGSGKPSAREPRCGPWDEQPDGSIVCRKCGDRDWPNAKPGPFGF